MIYKHCCIHHRIESEYCTVVENTKRRRRRIEKKNQRHQYVRVVVVVVYISRLENGNSDSNSNNNNGNTQTIENANAAIIFSLPKSSSSTGVPLFVRFWILLLLLLRFTITIQKRKRSASSILFIIIIIIRRIIHDMTWPSYNTLLIVVPVLVLRGSVLPPSILSRRNINYFPPKNGGEGDHPLRHIKWNQYLSTVPYRTFPNTYTTGNIWQIMFLPSRSSVAPSLEHSLSTQWWIGWMTQTSSSSGLWLWNAEVVVVVFKNEQIKAHLSMMMIWEGRI